MRKRSIQTADVRGKRVIVRVDFNVPFSGAVISDDSRVRESLPTIRHLMEHGAKTILISHLGRPKGKVVESLRLEPVARRLSQLLGTPVQSSRDFAGTQVERQVAALEDGQVLLLENSRFDPGEEANDPELARSLAALGDIFVLDAFGAAHRAHASTTGIASYLPTFAGFLMIKELNALARITQRPTRPLAAVLGGAKVSDKLTVLDGLLDHVNLLLVGGGMANTFLLAAGSGVGTSLVERHLLTEANRLIEKASARKINVLIPIDVVTGSSLDDSNPTVVPAERVAPDQAIYDIGPRTIQQYIDRLRTARTVFWNGPMGVFERSAYASGTEQIAAAVATLDAYTVVGGGDSLAAIAKFHLQDQIDHLSTGGGASLEFVAGQSLPGVSVILDDRE